VECVWGVCGVCVECVWTLTFDACITVLVLLIRRAKLVILGIFSKTLTTSKFLADVLQVKKRLKFFFLLALLAVPENSIFSLRSFTQKTPFLCSGSASRVPQQDSISSLHSLRSRLLKKCLRSLRSRVPEKGSISSLRSLRSSFSKRLNLFLRSQVTQKRLNFFFAFASFAGSSKTLNFLSALASLGFLKKTQFCFCAREFVKKA